MSAIFSTPRRTVRNVLATISRSRARPPIPGRWSMTRRSRRSRRAAPMSSLDFCPTRRRLPQLRMQRPHLPRVRPRRGSGCVSPHPSPHRQKYLPARSASPRYGSIIRSIQTGQMMADTAAQPPKRYSRFGLYVPIFALLVLAIGWSIFWYTSATITGREIGAWIKREAADGRNWTCSDRSVGGYPFRIEISCKEPSFSGPAAGVPVKGKLAGIHLVAQLYNPKLIIGEADGPLDLALPQDGSQTTANWKLLQISVRGEPDTLQRASLSANQIDVKATLPNGSSFKGRADNLQIHMRQGTQDQHAYDFAVTATNAVSSDLDNATGIDAPATLQAN